MANEDFTTYTEEDPSSHLTVIASKIDWIAFNRSEAAWVVSDKGVNHFDGDFTHLFELFVDTGTSGFSIYAPSLSNTLGSIADVVTASGYTIHGNIYESGAGYVVYVGEHDAGTWSGSASMSLSNDTLYYCKFQRDVNIGANGTIYIYVYSDADRTTLVDSESFALTSDTDFRYCYGIQSRESGDDTQTGYIQNLDLQEAAGGNAPTGVIYGPLHGPLAGPI